MTIHFDQKRYRRLLRFLRANHILPRRYHEFAVSRACFGCKTGKEKLHAIFRNAIQSNSESGLTKSANAVRKFAEQIGTLPGGKRIAKRDFLNCFDAESIEDVHSALTKIPDVGGKKAALFVRDLFVTQDLPPRCKIFRRRFISERDLFIPLDIVIASILARISNPPAFGKRDYLGNAFAETNKEFRRRFRKNHMIIEDLWFWGYFGMKGTSYDRYPEINSDKLDLDPYFSLHSVPTAAFREFCEILQ